MSPRAAWRLEALGFTEVYDYVAGKQDWLAAGLPVEGRLAAIPRAGDVARADVPRCRLDDRVGDVRERMRSEGAETCVVVNDHDVVLGILRPRHVEGDPDRRVEEAMQPGPSTFRPHVPIMDMARHMDEHGVSSVPITTGDGTLVGLLRHEDAMRVAREVHDALHGPEDEEAG